MGVMIGAGYSLRYALSGDRHRTMNDNYNRREFLKSGALFPLAAAAGLGHGGISALAETKPIKRAGGPMLKVSLNAYSFSKLLNDKVKRHGAGVDLFDLVDFCAKYNFDGFDATGYFFPGYPNVPGSENVNDLKRKAFELGVGISGSGVRNNFTQPDKTKRAAD